MNYKQFLNLSDEDAGKYMFDQLNEKFYTPIGLRVLNTFMLIQIYFFITIIAIFNLVTYDEGRFKYMLDNVLSVLQVTRILIFLFVVIVLFELANILYKAYQENKLLKNGRNKKKT